MWRPQSFFRLSNLSTPHINLFKSRIQVTTYRRALYTQHLELDQQSASPRFQYKRPVWPELYPDTEYLPPFPGAHGPWPVDTPVDRTCNELSRLINRLIDSRELDITDFCDTIHVSTRSYRCFMNQNGTWDGKRTATFAMALHYFQQREQAGVKIARKPAAKPKGPRSKAKPPILSLDGQTLDSVPVYDTCHEIRRKINAHMRQPGVTQRGFLQSLSAQYYLTPTKITQSQFEKFRGARGRNSENTNLVFYAAYVFFEKARVGGEKAKSQLRERIEELYRETGGMNTKVPSDKYDSWLGTQKKGFFVAFLRTFLLLLTHSRNFSSILTTSCTGTGTQMFVVCTGDTYWHQP